MMFKGYGVVWDAKMDKPLVRFENGVVEVTSPTIAKQLSALGYQSEGEIKDEQDYTAPAARRSTRKTSK